ncbi:FadR family transcriptional regulator [Cellulophaga sp. HaHaR_3_176]|uniref:FadR/GntR family transcriptional regulator n=1 Tax=Cellulophaga sp. HaHaR_3_176 TaxID=1942464 RepID=UPI001C1FBCA5|nr:FCD domain-containing protein [Cellulophaga sp. HaHaR_3_176]QWX84878.1 FadR family transcriptional regulator [Cellulophaga sp. HaHaR_3_176]
MKLNPVRIKDNAKIHHLIISKIRDFIDLRKLVEGDKLPSERELSVTLNVSRRNVREAIDKLEFYGIVKSIPQTGIFINTGRVALIGMIDGLLTLGEQDFLSLVESRLMLENKAVFLAATRRTVDDLQEIEIALDRYKSKILSKESALEEDLLFHLAIAKASKNTTIYEMMLQIIPKIIAVFVKTRVCDEEGFNYEIDKHESIFQAIKNRKPEEAVKLMEFHFELLIEFCDDFKERVV